MAGTGARSAVLGAALLALLAAVAAQQASATADAAGKADDRPAPWWRRTQRVRRLEPAASSYIILLNDAEPVVAAPGGAGSAFKAARRARRGGVAAASAAADAPAGAWAAVEAYRAGLRRRHAEVFASVAADVGTAGAGSAPRLTHHFTVAANGFAAAGLSAAQVAALRARTDVLSVTRSRVVRPLTFSTPATLGLNGPGALWEAQFGSPEAAAADMLVGVVDDGIDPTAEPFSSVAGRPANSWTNLGPGSAACSEAANTCTTGKLLACRSHAKAADEYVAQSSGIVRAEEDYGCTAKGEGHGVHTASTAAGNFGSLVQAGLMYDQASGISGMAPGAAVAAYKIIWTFRHVEDNSTEAGGMTEDIMDAVDTAVADGVDVINYSVGGGTLDFSFTDPLWESFKGAAAAGVVISAAAGNEGEDYFGGTVPGSANDNGCPWVITVAAGTHPRRMYGEITLTTAADGARAFRGVPGKSNVPAGPTGVYYGGSDSFKALCFDGRLDPVEVAGKIVLCRRGSNGLYEKAGEVARAGGVAMVLFNTPTSRRELLREDWPVPTLHLDAATGADMLAFFQAAAGDNTTSGYLSPQRVDPNPAEAPSVAGFSSRGPLLTDGSYLLKPDILAPGVEVFAALPGGRGGYWDGTSMATPHVTGIAALIKSKHPDWSPAAIKSALMTTANLTTNYGNPIDGTAFDYGAGLINPSAALDPGLVYDVSSIDAWHRYSCAAVNKRAWTSSGARLEGKPPLPGYCKAACRGGSCAWPQALLDVNVPSFSFPAMRGGSTALARRAVTYVGSLPAASFTPTLTLPAGVTGQIVLGAKLPRRSGGATPAPVATLPFAAPDQVQAFTLTVTVGRDAPQDWSFGSLVFTDATGRYSVRSAIAIQRV